MIEKKIKETLKPFMKNEEELRKETKKRLSDHGFDTDDGSIANLFSNIINKNIYDVYEKMSELHLGHFLSTATGAYLDDIAKTKNITRQDDESDEELRYRITIADMVNVSCNFTSIRQIILLNFPNVYDVRKKDYTKGAGSFSLYIHSNDDSLSELEEIKTVALTHIPSGINWTIEYPKVMWLRLKIKINTDAKTDTELINIKKKVINSLENLFSKLQDNDVVSYYDIINCINTSHDSINNSSIIESELDSKLLKISQLSIPVDKRIAISNDTEIIF